MVKKQRPVRYWPGKAPQGANQGSSSDSEEETVQETTKSVEHVRHQEPVPIQVTLGAKPQESRHETLVQEIPVAEDPRLKRLMRQEESSDEEDEEVTVHRRRPVESTQHVSEPIVQEQQEDEDELALRRQQLKERALQRQQVEEPEDIPEQEEESEYTTDEEESEDDRILLKPVFVPKNHRDSVKDQDELEAEREKEEALKKEKQEERRNQTRHLLEEQIRRELAEVNVNEIRLEVDDTDNVNEEEEYQAWKLRELTRIKRDRQEMAAFLKEQRDKERRRAMTDAEVMEENKVVKPEKEKAKIQFLQRYYHKGAFYQDMEDDVMKRDYNLPTLEDKVDKTILPQVMQVKKFGKIGRTKYTHLTDQDTTQRDSAWAQKNEVAAKVSQKMAGMKQSFEKPTKRRRV